MLMNMDLDDNVPVILSIGGKDFAVMSVAKLRELTMKDTAKVSVTAGSRGELAQRIAATIDEKPWSGERKPTVSDKHRRDLSLRRAWKILDMLESIQDNVRVTTSPQLPDDIAHRLLGEMCVCYAEAWPEQSADEARRSVVEILKEIEYRPPPRVEVIVDGCIFIDGKLTMVKDVQRMLDEARAK